MVVSALFFLIAAAPAKTVNFECEVSRAGRAIPALSKVCGVAMRVEGQVADEVIFISAKKMPLPDLLSAIARTTCSEWRRERPGSYVLWRPPRLIRSVIDAHRKQMSREVNAWRDDLVKCLDEEYTERHLTRLVSRKRTIDQLPRMASISTSEWEAMHKDSKRLERLDPLYRALARCLRNLDLSPLVDQKHSLTFCQNPNKMQLALPPSSVEAMERLQDEQKLWGQVLLGNPDGDYPYIDDQMNSALSQVPEISDIPITSTPWMRTLPYDRKPAFTVLTVDLNARGYLQVDMKMVDADRKPVLSFQTTDWIHQYNNDGNKERGNAMYPKSIKASEETSQLMRRLAVEDYKPNIPIAKIRRFIDDPVNNDFLWFGNQEILTALAKEQRKSVVACLPDALFRRDLYGLTRQYFTEQGRITVSQNNSCIEIRPTSFVNHWREKASREQLARCIQSYRKYGKIPIQEMAKLAGPVDDSWAMSPAAAMAQILDPEFRFGYVRYHLGSQPETLFFSSLTPAQMNALKLGRTLPYKSLTKDQLDLAETIVFGRSIFSASFLGPTFDLPTGLREDNGVSASFQDEVVAVFHGQRGKINEPIFSATLGQPLPMNSRVYFMPIDGLASVTVTLHHRKTIMLAFAIDAVRRIPSEFVEPIGRATGKPMLIKNLPDSVAKQLESALVHLRNEDISYKRFREERSKKRQTGG